MLYEFITTYRDAIIARSREKLTARPWPTASEQELENGVPTFLTQLSEALRAESTGAHESPAGIGSAATRHGQELMALGFTANQQRRERMFVAPLLEDIGAGGLLHAESRGMQFAIEPSDPTWEVTADPQLIASAVTNLLNNAFKHTKPGGRVVLRAQTTATRASRSRCKMNAAAFRSAKATRFNHSRSGVVGTGRASAWGCRSHGKP